MGEVAAELDREVDGLHLAGGPGVVLSGYSPDFTHVPPLPLPALRPLSGAHAGRGHLENRPCVEVAKHHRDGAIPPPSWEVPSRRPRSGEAEA